MVEIPKTPEELRKDIQKRIEFLQLQLSSITSALPRFPGTPIGSMPWLSMDMDPLLEIRSALRKANQEILQVREKFEL